MLETENSASPVARQERPAGESVRELPAAVSGEYFLEISRMFNAPRELVFQAWTEPKMLAMWMGPRGFDACEVESDLRVGGTWRLCLATNGDVETGCDPRGVTRLYQRGTYLEIVPPERLVFTFQWENRNVERADRENKVTITFRELEGKTVMDFKHGPFETVEDRDGHNTGWTSAFEKFAAFMAMPVGAEKPKKTALPEYELNITRVFDAPRELVWKAWTDPEMAKEWMGPRGFKATEFSTSDKAGDRWHMRMEGKVPHTGAPVVLHQGGVILEVRPPEMMRYTFSWEDRSCVGLPVSPFKENEVTVRFEEKDGKTEMHFRQTPFATEDERNGHNGGWNSTFDRFAEYIVAQQPVQVPTGSDTPSEVHLRRVVKASRQEVFDAWTKPELLMQWWGPDGFTTPLCELDVRGGGAMRIHMKGPDGNIYPMTGRYIEVYPPFRFHYLSTPLDASGAEMFELWNSVFLDGEDDAVEVVVDCHITRSTPAAAPYLKGMPIGWAQTMDRMAAYFESSASSAGAQLQG